MSAKQSRDGRPHRVRRAVVLLPNGFTLANLFCGIFAIIQASQTNYDLAVRFVVIGGLADALDGRVARATGSGSRFGEELDSLVDAISFGLAPAMIMFFAVFDPKGWDWILVFVFTSCAVMRLARFNVEQAGRAKTHFHGLPTPAAGMALASYWWFSNTPLYRQSVILFTDTTIADLPWHKIIGALMLLLGGLMMSDVPYLAVPTIGFRTWRQRIGTVVMVGIVVGLIWGRQEFIFPAIMAYIVIGLLQWVILGLLARRRTSPHAVYWELEPEDLEELDEVDDLDDGDEDDEPETIVSRPTRTSGAAPERPPHVATPPLALTDEAKPPRRRRHRRRSSGPSSGSPGRGQSQAPGPKPPNPEPPKSPA